MKLSPPLLRITVCMLLPAAAGIAIATWLTPRHEIPAPPLSVRKALKETDPLPRDSEVIQMAAYAGRTTEARIAVTKALAEGASDFELIEWLRNLVRADPAWFEIFLKDVPDERKRSLIVHVLDFSDHDTVWNLVRTCPSIRELLGEPNGSDPSALAICLQKAASSSLAGDMIFGPDLNLSHQDLLEICKSGRPARELIQEWRKGNWPEGKREDRILESACMELQSSDPTLLQTLLNTAPPGFEAQAKSLAALANLTDRDGQSYKNEATAANLRLLNPEDLQQILTDRKDAAQPVPPEAIAATMKDFTQMEQDLPDASSMLLRMQSSQITTGVARISSLDLTENQRQVFIALAVRYEWQQFGDLEQSLDWTTMLNGSAREKVQEEIIDQAAASSPAMALAYAKQMPPGDLRDHLEAKANAQLPGTGNAP